MSSIQPLRIQKTTPSSSPVKMSGLPMQRPLSELSPMAQRRNSPSYNQNTKKPTFGGDSSPFDSSPFPSNSPRLYWQSRDSGSPTRFNSENKPPTDQRDSSPSPSKRSSIENLKRASRVKNSNMFAREHKQEYDPTSSPMIERPLASGRPLSVQAQSSVYGGKDLKGFRKENLQNGSKYQLYSPTKSPAKMDALPEVSKTPSKVQASPTKSSMSSKSRYAQAQAFDPENGIWSDEEESFSERQLPPGKSLHRHAKSVTFDAAPPQVNEYEMTTPDPSSVASGSREGSYESIDNEEDESFDRGSSIDHDDSFDASLEDTDKTPVVLPEDWRFMSPATANDDLAAHVENPFDEERSSPSPTTRPSSATNARVSPARTDSANSNGERRPLPPLPGLNMPTFTRPRSESNGSLSATAERVSSAQRILPSPPRPASISKSEIQGMGGCSMSLEDRLRLMMLQNDESNKSPAEEQRERRLRRTQSKSPDHAYGNKEPGIRIHEDEVENDDVADLGDYQLPPRISRESILRKVKSQGGHMDDGEFEFSSPAPSESPGRGLFSNIDPDIPLPSLETEPPIDYGPASPVIKKEDDEESEVDVYSIPDLYSQHLQAESYMDAIQGREALEERLGQVASQTEDDDESHYSNDSTREDQPKLEPSAMIDDETLPTPRASSPNQVGKAAECKSSHRMSLPQFASMLGEQDFGFGMESFLTPTPPVDEEPVTALQNQDPAQVSTPPEPAKIQPSVERPVTPEAQLEPPRFPGQWNDQEEEPRTPDSVIRHPIADSPLPESPSVPEPIATIKAPGGKLKTRPSITPADIQAMAETRRQVSGGIPLVPSIPTQHQSRPSIIMETSMIDSSDLVPHGSELDSNSEKPLAESEATKQPKRKSSLVQLEIPVEDGDGLGFGLDKEFDRVIEAQKVAFTFPYYETDAQPRSPGYAEYIGGQEFKPISEYLADKRIRTQKGYLMRQNTKVVIASSASHESTSDATESVEASARGTRSAGNSPRKASHTQTWTTEPWNGKIRRKSIRQSGGNPSKKPSSGPAPPLPGQPSNVASGLGSVNEDELAQTSDEFEDGAERGRLFVKVVRVKDLDMPLPKGERSYFALTLDNGLHCVTTAWLELGKTAPIGQEFELVVLNDLEFQLTLQTKLEEPKAKPTIVESPTKTTKSAKPSTFSRVFASPRKRKELEMKQQEEAQKADRQRQQDAQASRRATQPTAWDLLNGLVAKDGSFARSYICLKDHESGAYGRPYTVDVPCFNEWATEEVTSIKSKRSGTGGGVQRKAPYRIGKLELQLLFIPKPKQAKDDDMPKSMNACIRELKEAEATASKSWEGFLSQQGGDCPYWRRRFFSLDGPKLIAYHESTRQPRATINLAKASKLIDDKSALMRKETSSKSGGRRKSAFAEEEEGYMFVEEGFRIRFANGETIDFYADSAAQKDEWMKVLGEVVGKEGKVKGWTDLVLAKQRAQASKLAQAQQGQSKAHSARSAPPTPAKQHSPSKRQSNQGFAPPPVQKDARHPPVGQRRADPSKTRSMVF